MPSGKTPRRGLTWLKASDAPELSKTYELLANELDNDVEIHQGVLSARPGAALSGRMYFVQGDANEVNNGVLWVDNGTTWVAINATPSPPIGTINHYTGASDPSANWLLTNGRELSRTAYASAFAVMGTTFGAGNGTTTFNIPLCAERVLVAPGGAFALGGKGGTPRVTLTAAQSGLRNHVHSLGVARARWLRRLLLPVAGAAARWVTA